MAYPECPECHETMQFVMHPPPEEAKADQHKIVVPLDSDIYRCQRHGNFRVYISGSMKKYPG